MQNELYIVADAIKALREARGLTQEQLAEKADISVSHLAKMFAVISAEISLAEKELELLLRQRKTLLQQLFI